MSTVSKYPGDIQNTWQYDKFVFSVQKCTSVIQKS